MLFWERFKTEIISERQPFTVAKDIFIIRKFDPLIRWFIGYGIFEIAVRNHYAVGFLYGSFGNWSRIRHRSFRIKRWTFYISLGECEPYNPQTGTAWK